MKAPVAGTLFLILAGLLLTAAPAQAVTILVDDDEVQCPAALFNTIQAAINVANPGDIVRVCPGVYNEQIVIDNTKASPLTVRGDNGAIIMPSPMIANTTSLTSGAPMAAVVLIKDASALTTIQTITVDAGGNGSTGCAPHIVGILVQNADARVLNAAVRNAKLGAGLEGCQTGLGIFAQSSGGGTSDVTVEGTSVHDYQKNGITGNEPGTFLIAKTNRVTGWGPTPYIAQNGIQIGWGASGVIDSNTVANHVWSPCVSAEDCDFVSTNILVFGPDPLAIAPPKVLRNHVTRSQVNIYIEADDSTINTNTVTDTDVWDGIYVLGDNNIVQSNTVTNSDEAGVLVDGTGNNVTKNKINEALVGVWSYSGSNIIAPNTYYNVVHKTVTGPGPLSIASSGANRVSAVR
jgi:hypothetical protein